MKATYLRRRHALLAKGSAPARGSSVQCGPPTSKVSIETKEARCTLKVQPRRRKRARGGAPAPSLGAGQATHLRRPALAALCAIDTPIERRPNTIATILSTPSPSLVGNQINQHIVQPGRHAPCARGHPRMPFCVAFEVRDMAQTWLKNWSLGAMTLQVGLERCDFINEDSTLKSAEVVPRCRRWV